MTAPTDGNVARAKGQSWHWPPRPFTFAVAGCVLAIAFVVNFPAVEVPHADLGDGKYGTHFDIVTDYEHGWPMRYSRRDLWRRSNLGESPSPWRPWQGARELSIANLLIDLGLWSLVLVVAGAAAGYWRSRRRAIWQLGLRDLLVLTGVAGLVCAWIAATRAEYLHEQSLRATYRERTGNSGMEHEVGARVPAFLTDSLQGRYRELFNRTYYFHSDGHSDLACQCRHVITLRETTFHPDFPRHLRQMQSLEALDLSFTNLPYFDATKQATILRDLAPMANLRGINLYSTNATDADMTWLATCPRLEVIDLSDTKIGDHGLAHLARLPRLRKLTIGNDRISDRGCRAIADMPALEELSLASRNIHDAGLIELSKRQTLRTLKIGCSATEAAFEVLRKELPQCQMNSHRLLKARSD